jgi:hypothetical protein
VPTTIKMSKIRNAVLAPLPVRIDFEFIAYC